MQIAFFRRQRLDVRNGVANRPRFQAGDRVVVRSPEEILATLDGDGTLARFPFMPEMLDSCGKVFQVERRVEKICAPDLPLRRFADDDVVVLEGVRCDGSAHDGCKDGCKVLWKEAWLRPFDPAIPTTPISPAAIEQLRARLKVKSDERHYFCQSTERLRATLPFAGRQKVWMARIAIREIRNGDLPAGKVFRLFAVWFWQRMLRAAGCDEWLRGRDQRTPTESLNLQPGELVRVKSRAEIAQTLDRKIANRGMGFCYEMTRCCGHEAEVRYRVDRIIDEKTGTMRELSNTVTLRSIGGARALEDECSCYGEPGDCPRAGLMYWREIWLERVKASA